MNKINEIQNAIIALNGNTYHKLMDLYIYEKFQYENITPYGIKTGTDKALSGIPDSYVYHEDGQYTFIMYGTRQELECQHFNGQFL